MTIGEGIHGPGEPQWREGHPTPETLSAYHAGGLSPSSAEGVQDHLALCSACTRALLALPYFYAESEAPASSQGEDAAAEASWQAVRARLVPTLGWRPERARDDLRDHRFRPLLTSPATVYALAASLAACLVGFPVWIALHRTAEPSAALALSLPAPSGTEVTRGDGKGAPISVQLAAGSALVVLPIPPEPAFPAYRIEVLTLDGKRSLLAIATPVPFAAPPSPPPAALPQAAPAAGRRLLPLALAARALPPGDYRVRVLGLRDDRVQAIAELPLHILGAGGVRSLWSRVRNNPE